MGPHPISGEVKSKGSGKGFWTLLDLAYIFPSIHEHSLPDGIAKLLSADCDRFELDQSSRHFNGVFIPETEGVVAYRQMRVWCSS